MPHADSLSEQVLDVLAGQLGQTMTQVMGPAIRGANQAELTETFSVWMLGLDGLAQGSDDLEKLATQTGRWHHQIKTDGRTEAFARSRPLGADPSSWRLTEIFQSELAQKIDASINWVDANVQGDPLVRLLAVPAYHLTVFWLVGDKGNQVVIVDAPSYFSSLPVNQVLDQKEFLDTLRGLAHIVGRTK